MLQGHKKAIDQQLQGFIILPWIPNMPLNCSSSMIAKDGIVFSIDKYRH